MYQAQANYWPDVAHIAERVLTINELIAFVDKYIPAPSPSALNSPKNVERDSADARLRNLLARRLMRTGQYQKVLVYFALAEDRDAAQAFINALPKKDKKRLRSRASGKRRGACVIRGWN
ncbi:hypothetical protein [Klebsiella sp. JB_Kp019]|uniref:hypothetical protein n=1 Tax=unclassified Klebsiella TaxID=2608929 RepID=UPI0032B30F42